DPVVLDQPGELGAPLRPTGLCRVGGRGEQRRGLEVANSGFVEVRRARALLIAVAARLERAEVEALALRLVDLLRGRAFRRGLLGEGGNREGESHCDGESDPFHSFTISPPLSALRYIASIRRMSRRPISPGVLCGVLVFAARLKASS